MHRAVGLVLAPLLATSTAAAAQTTLDEGTFRHLVDGREVATETFSIKETGAGAEAVVIATGRVLFREGSRQEMTSVLQVAGPVRRPTGYDLTVAGDSAQRIRAQVTGTRFSARIVRASGERAREYLVSEGAVVAEIDVAHHQYFVASRVLGNARRIPLIVPLEGRQVFATASLGEAESIRVADTTITARRITVSVEGGSERRIWIDDAGRVLRVEVPARSFVAERTALPQ